MCWCLPILLPMLQYCFCDPGRAFGHVVKEWRPTPSPFAPIVGPGLVPGAVLSPCPPPQCVHCSCMCWCLPILLPMLQYCFCDPGRAFGHVVKEWRAFPSPFTPIMVRFGCPGQFSHLDPLRSVFTPPVCVGACPFFYPCCSIVFVTQGEPLGM